MSLLSVFTSYVKLYEVTDEASYYFPFRRPGRLAFVENAVRLEDMLSSVSFSY